MNSTTLHNAVEDRAAGMRAFSRALRIWLVLGLAALAALVLAMSIGSSAIPAVDVIHYLLRAEDNAASQVIRELRLPRALAAFGAGGLLAFAGALMQVLLRNPLADPYVLGLSSGSAVERSGGWQWVGLMISFAGVSIVIAGQYGSGGQSVGLVMYLLPLASALGLT